MAIRTESLTPDVAPWIWRGVAEWLRSADGGWEPRRISEELIAIAFNEHFAHKGRTPAGSYATFRTDAEVLDVTGRQTDFVGSDRLAVIDIVVNGELVARSRSRTGEPGAEVACSVSLPDGTNTVEVWLPHHEPFILMDLAVTGGTAVEPIASRPLWATYGSSITQCEATHGPAETWPAVVARYLDVDSLGLGFGGQCHLDEAVARTIVAAEPDMVSLCVGINVYGRGSYDERSFASTVYGFVSRLMADLPEAPFVLMSPIHAPRLENEPNMVGLTLSRIRELVHDVGDHIDSPRLTVIDGLDILGKAHVDLLADDQLHPTHDGYQHMAARLAPRLRTAFADVINNR